MMVSAAMGRVMVMKVKQVSARHGQMMMMMLVKVMVKTNFVIHRQGI